MDFSYLEDIVDAFGMPSPTASDTETLASYYTPTTSPKFHGYDITSTAFEGVRIGDFRQNPRKIMDVIIKDAHDIKGQGMRFTLSYNAPLKYILEAFKAASCKTCRSADCIRFKLDDKRLKDEDTLQSVRFYPYAASLHKADVGVPTAECDSR